MNTALSVSGLTKTYGDGEQAVHAVQAVSFEASAGEFLAVVGPSGSGKTSLLAMIGGLLAPTSGSIVVDGRDVTTMTRRQQSAYRRQTVGFVFQLHHLVPYLTARENLLLMCAIGACANGARLADQLLADLDLTERAHARVAQLSGGERQRVAIARALMNDPKIVLVDEPTASLDSVRGQQVVRLLLEQVKARNKLAIMVTHDHEIAGIADRMLEMHDGRLLDDATAAIRTS